MIERIAWRGAPASAKALRGSGSALGGAGDRRLDVLIRNYAQVLNSEVALLCRLERHSRPPGCVLPSGTM